MFLFSVVCRQHCVYAAVHFPFFSDKSESPFYTDFSPGGKIVKGMASTNTAASKA